jgi:beta-lactamase superfamily II metal-dependent hydrolase
MKLRIFQSDMGDCLLLEDRDGKHRVLCDGGMAVSMRDRVRKHLAELDAIDFVYVSHIDNDHITGVLQLLQDELEWRIFEHHRKKRSGGAKKPSVPRPPKIGGLWHNAFRDQVGRRSAGRVENALGAAAPVLLGMGLPAFAVAGREMEEISSAVPEAIKVSRLASPQLLNLPVNKLPGASRPEKLLFLDGAPRAFKVGTMKFTIVGPTKKELNDLKTGWKNWLRENEDRVARIRAQLQRKIDEFSAGAPGNPFDLRDWNGVPDFEGVTAPNIASLMFMVEEGGKTLLLTGDSQQKIILKGLKLAGFLEPGHLHLDVLKVQHHGSENNVDEEFCRQVSADRYVFCGNGSHGNPETKVLEQFFESRVGPAQKQARSPKAKDRPFEFWFSTTSDAQKPGSDERENFAKVEKLVDTMKGKSGGRLKVRFNKGDFVDLAI